MGRSTEAAARMLDWLDAKAKLVGPQPYTGVHVPDPESELYESYCGLPCGGYWVAGEVSDPCVCQECLSRL